LQNVKGKGAKNTSLIEKTRFFKQKFLAVRSGERVEQTNQHFGQVARRKRQAFATGRHDP